MAYPGLMAYVVTFDYGPGDVVQVTVPTHSEAINRRNVAKAHAEFTGLRFCSVQQRPFR